MTTPQTDELRIEYVRLDKATELLWTNNPKKHDTELMCESIQTHGFRDAPAFDASLQDGGAIVDGNGRVVALRVMCDRGDVAPRGVRLDEDGMWCLPVQFGIDAPSRAAAEAYAIDANLMTVSGSGMSPWETGRMMDEYAYIPLLAKLAEEQQPPVALGDDGVEALLAAYGSAAGGASGTPAAGEGAATTSPPPLSDRVAFAFGDIKADLPFEIYQQFTEVVLMRGDVETVMGEACQTLLSAITD